MENDILIIAMDERPLLGWGEGLSFLKKTSLTYPCQIVVITRKELVSLSVNIERVLFIELSSINEILEPKKSGIVSKMYCANKKHSDANCNKLKIYKHFLLLSLFNPDIRGGCFTSNFLGVSRKELYYYRQKICKSIGVRKTKTLQICFVGAINELNCYVDF